MMFTNRDSALSTSAPPSPSWEVWGGLLSIPPHFAALPILSSSPGSGLSCTLHTLEGESEQTGSLNGGLESYPPFILPPLELQGHMVTMLPLSPTPALPLCVASLVGTCLVCCTKSAENF